MKSTLRELVLLPLTRPELFRKGNLSKPAKVSAVVANVSSTVNGAPAAVVVVSAVVKASCTCEQCAPPSPGFCCGSWDTAQKCPGVRITLENHERIEETCGLQ